jgi:hypothetical protein
LYVSFTHVFSTSVCSLLFPSSTQTNLQRGSFNALPAQFLQHGGTKTMSWRRRRRRKPRRSQTSTVEIAGERAIQASKRKRKKKRVIGKGNPTPSLKNRRPSLNPVIPGREGRGKVRFLNVEIENTNWTRARAILNLRKIESFRKKSRKRNTRSSRSKKSSSSKRRRRRKRSRHSSDPEEIEKNSDAVIVINTGRNRV